MYMVNFQRFTVIFIVICGDEPPGKLVNIAKRKIVPCYSLDDTISGTRCGAPVFDGVQLVYVSNNSMLSGCFWYLYQKPILIRFYKPT